MRVSPTRLLLTRLSTSLPPKARIKLGVFIVVCWGEINRPCSLQFLYYKNIIPRLHFTLKVETLLLVYIIWFLFFVSFSRKVCPILFHLFLIACCSSFCCLSGPTMLMEDSWVEWVVCCILLSSMAKELFQYLSSYSDFRKGILWFVSFFLGNYFNSFPDLLFYW